MIYCELRISDDVEYLYKIFSSETLSTERASCKIKKNKELIFNIEAKDPVSMKAFLNSILKVVQTHDKIKQIK